MILSKHVSSKATDQLRYKIVRCIKSLIFARHPFCMHGLEGLYLGSTMFICSFRRVCMLAILLLWLIFNKHVSSPPSLEGLYVASPMFIIYFRRVCIHAILFLGSVCILAFAS
jgi:hypothetical protein